MSARSNHIKENINKYINSISQKENEILKNLRKETYKLFNNKMHISPEQGQLISILTAIIKPKKVIEIGVFTGYSSISFAKEMEETSKLIACDTNKEYTKLAQKYWSIAKVENKINLKLAPAIETLKKLLKTNWLSNTDIIFIDADKQNYLNYYKLSFKLIKQGGIILIDNTLWQGKVLEDIQNKQTKEIHKLNQFLSADKNINLSIIPIGDGLTIIRKK